jgi:hypothetical protein
VVLDLDLSSGRTLEVRTGDSTWRRSLTNRHAEILLLLHAAGPAGLPADALGRALFGDADHLVTVRAEVSRLRRVLGTLVDTRPYRLADGTRTKLGLGPAGELRGCPLVRASTSPGVQALAATGSG